MRRAPQPPRPAPAGAGGTPPFPGRLPEDRRGGARRRHCRARAGHGCRRRGLFPRSADDGSQRRSAVPKITSTGTSRAVRRSGTLRSARYAPFRRSTVLNVRYVMPRTSAISSSGTSTGRVAVALIPLRIVASERLNHRSGPRRGPNRTRRRTGCGRSASGLGCADQRERPHQVGALFGKRGGAVAAAGVPDRGDLTKAEVVEHRGHPARLVGQSYDGAGGDWPHPGRSTRMT